MMTIESINSLLKTLKLDYIHKLYRLKANDNNFKYIAKGGQGVVYRINNSSYAIKIIKKIHLTNREKLASDIIERSGDINFIKYHLIHNIDSYVLIVMDLADGTLAEWVKVNHSECDWFNMIFQIVMAVYIMGTKYKMLHTDMKPKNILYKRYDVPQILKYDINGKHYTIKSKYLFIISDFGHAILLDHPESMKNYNRSDIEQFIKSNADLYELASIYKRILVDHIMLTYDINELKTMGKNDQHFVSYYNDTVNDAERNLAKYPQNIKEKMIARSIAYYLVEKNMISIDDTKIPSKNVINILDSILYNSIEKILGDTHAVLTKMCT